MNVEHNTAYFYYFGEINPFGANNLIILTSTKILQGCNHIYLCISSKGGCNFSALTLYNYLNNLPVKFTIHNIGFVESAANIIFMAASERIASPNSRFIIHGSKTKFPNDLRFTSNELLESANGLINDEQIFSNIISSTINCPISTVELWLNSSQLFTPDDAIENKLIDRSENFSLPIGKEFIGISTIPPQSK